MSLRGWNKGKSSTVLCKGRKKGGETEKRGGRGSKHLPAALAAGKFNFDPVDSAVIPKFNL